MKFILSIAIMGIVVSSTMRADDLYTKNGLIYRNIVVIDSTENYLRINTSNGMRSIPLSIVVKIEKNIYGPAQELRIDEVGNEAQTDGKKPRFTYTRPNTKFLVVAVMSFALSWDYFVSASDLGDQIDKLKLIPNYNTNDLEKQKLRKTSLGVLFLATGIASAIIASEKVEIKASPNSLTLSYNF